ncbi:WbqC family protein [Aeromonas rivuli]|uniref:WbqC family protein n=1 Tax=Aeromonas rivuli TaxID=648794 RepID=UPI001CCAD464|nr:WbqC family protein [Aeromonas rivuli]UBO72686.1 WbqC family protein [Aeromonas rivuli]
MIVSIHQPAYLPWLGYVDRIKKSDLFIFLDSVQLEKNSFTNRNLIKGANGSHWLTIPINKKGHLSKSLIDIEMASDIDWRKNHLKSIKNNYSKCAEFHSKYIRLYNLYENNETHLADLCFNHLLFWLEEFDINTKIIRSSSLNISSKKSDLILNICQEVGATTYLSGPMGKNYLEENNFISNGIKLNHHSFEQVPYPQLFGPFIPYMGIIDYWFNLK